VFLWQFNGNPPPILDGLSGSDFDHDRPFTAAVFREHLLVVTETGLMAELTQEGFKIDRKQRAAQYYWSTWRCENWLYLDWRVDHAGNVQSIAHGWQAGC